MAGMTIELSEHVIDAIADAVVKKMQQPKVCDIDAIRAEIEALKVHGIDDVSISNNYAIDKVLQIIDRYTK